MSNQTSLQMTEKPNEKNSKENDQLLPGLVNIALKSSDQNMASEDDWRTKVKRNLYIDFPLIREGIAEFLGTAILIMFGNGVVAQSVLSEGNAGGYLSINFGWALAVTFAVTVAGGVSGGHVNPAMSLAFYIFGDINVFQLCVYVVSQMLGAIFGSAIVFAVYFEAMQAFDGGNRQVTGSNATAGIFSTYPQPFLSAGGGLVDQIVGTALLATCVLALSDKNNMQIPKPMVPAMVGCTVAAIGICYGFNCGYAINPARDLGPRIFTSMAGWGIEVFSYRNYNWFWIPVIGPIIGAILGAGAYKMSISNHWPKVQTKTDTINIDMLH